MPRPVFLIFGREIARYGFPNGHSGHNRTNLANAWTRVVEELAA